MRRTISDLKRKGDRDFTAALYQARLKLSDTVLDSGTRARIAREIHRIIEYFIMKSAMDVQSLELTVRSENCLRSVGIDTIEQLANTRLSELRGIKRLGRKSLNEIVECLHNRYIELKE